MLPESRYTIGQFGAITTPTTGGGYVQPQGQSYRQPVEQPLKQKPVKEAAPLQAAAQGAVNGVVNFGGQQIGIEEGMNILLGGGQDFLAHFAAANNEKTNTYSLEHPNHQNDYLANNLDININDLDKYQGLGFEMPQDEDMGLFESLRQLIFG